MSLPRILVTGMGGRHMEWGNTSHQTSFMRELHGLIREELRGRVDIDTYALKYSELRETADSYDLILIGLSSPWASLSHSTFHVAGWASMMADDPDLAARTVFVFDTREPLMLLHAFDMAWRDPEMFLHDDFMGRPEAFLAATDPDRLLKGCHYLAAKAETWPRTIVPVHAWHNPLPLNTKLLPPQVQAKLIPVNIDRRIVSRFAPRERRITAPTLKPQDHWWVSVSTEGYFDTEFEQRRFPFRGKAASDLGVVNSITDSLGMLVPPGKFGYCTTWTRHVPLGVVSHSPVFSAIAETHRIGNSWAVTPQDAENMSRAEQLMLGQMQSQEFMLATPLVETVRDTVLSLIAGVMPRSINLAATAAEKERTK